MSRITTCALALFIAVGIFSVTPAMAQLLGQNTDPTTTSLFPMSGNESLLPSMGRLAVTLVLVLGLIWGTLWFARRVTRRGLRGGQSAVRVIERAHLAPKKSIEVVAVGERVLVLGITETSIALLTEMDPGEFPEFEANPVSADSIRKAQLNQKNLLKQAQKRMQEMFGASHLPAVENMPNA